MDSGVTAFANVGRATAGGRWRAALPAPFTVVATLLALLAAAVIFAPVFIMFARHLFPHGGLDLQAFSVAFARNGIGTAFRNSLIVVLVVNLTAVPIGVVFAWLNFRTDARMGYVTTLLPVLPLLLPSVALVIGWVFLGSDQSGFLTSGAVALLRLFGADIGVSPVHIFSWPGLLFLYAIELMPIVYVLTGAAYRSTDPALEEAARINGSSIAKTFLTVSLPIVRHAVLLSMLLVSVLAIGIYSIPAIIGAPARITTLSVHLVRLLNGESPPAFRETAVLSLVLIMIFGCLWMAQQRLNAAGRHAQIGGQGIRANVICLGNTTRLIARMAMIGYVVLTCILPILALLLVSLQPFWTPDVDFARLSFDNFTELFENRDSRTAITNSMTIATVSSLTTLLIAALLMAYALSSGGLREKAIGVLTKVPAAISHLVIASGIIIGFGGAPFYLANTTVILMLAYFVFYIPKASIAAEAAIRQVGPQLSEASRICGAGGARTMWAIVLPLMLPGLAAGWALIFASVIAELTGSVILSGPRNLVMGYLLMTIYESGTYSQLAALAAVIAAISGVTVGIAMALAKPRFGGSATLE